MTKLGRFVGLSMVAVVSVGLLAGMVYADAPLQSAHYQLDEGTLGSGGLIQSGSANYQSTEAIGSAAVGNSSSANFQVEAGPKTTPDPALAFGVTNASANFGNFSQDTTATATAAFSVSDYTSYGYAVQIIGNPPKNVNHTITAMAATAAPQTGIEQFGINLVANTIPKAFGAAPDQGQFGAGVAATNYNTPNVYRYVSGETIATAPKSSGVTTFTISYVVNVNNLTPGGAYTSAQSVVCTGTF